MQLPYLCCGNVAVAHHYPSSLPGAWHKPILCSNQPLGRPAIIDKSVTLCLNKALACFEWITSKKFAGFRLFAKSQVELDWTWTLFENLSPFVVENHVLGYLNSSTSWCISQWWPAWCPVVDVVILKFLGIPNYYFKGKMHWPLSECRGSW
jgi:hypothetical protein